MKPSKLILLTILTILITTNLNASRIKKDLLPNQENEIVVLLKEKIVIVDKLIIEAKIYKNEKDPLIEKSWFNTPSLFVSQAKDNSQYIQTGITSSSVFRNGKFYGILGMTRKHPFKYRVSRPRIGLYNPSEQRKILNIDMTRKYDATTSFSNNINYLHILVDVTEDNLVPLQNKEQKEEIIQIIDHTTDTKFQPLITELLQKYAELISLLSDNDISKNINKMIKSNTVERWNVHSRMFVFKLNLKMDKFYKKKRYDSSVIIHDIFEKLYTGEYINLTKAPVYYGKKIDKKLRCLETAKHIKYKSRICINPIDVDKDKYFKNGVFETRENNFIHQNAEHFKTLISLDAELREAGIKYIEFLILKVTSPTKKSEINLRGGL